MLDRAWPPELEELDLPDRFEGLAASSEDDLRSIIVPVEDTLAVIDRHFSDMRAARRGALMILRGGTGAGKTTFLNTVGLFRRDVVTERIAGDEDVATALKGTEPTATPRVLVIEGREALGEISPPNLEATVHAINTFARSANGRETLVVWPTNTDDLTELLCAIAANVGGEALVGVAAPVVAFTGPPKSHYVGIAERTVAARNHGASLAALGISDEQARNLVGRAPTIGRFLALIRSALLENLAFVRGLLPSESFHLWTLVIAGNDPEGDVAALTRTSHAYADIPRLMAVTNANIVKELREQEERVGILGTTLDARILHLDIVTALAVARSFGDAQLHEFMRNKAMSTRADRNAVERLRTSDLGAILTGRSLGARRLGAKPRDRAQRAFRDLASIASSNDHACNRAIGTGLVRAGLIEEFDVEVGLGINLTYKSDLLIVHNGQSIRIEVMWRKTTSRAAIADYALRKLYNYGRAIGLLE
jgi:hypothetical protein